MIAVPLSILMPSYNPGQYLRRAVTSAVEQFEPGDELVIQDGGSTDGSIAALSSDFAGDDRVKVVSEQDTGQSEALQRALARALNPHVGWLNADDLYYPGALAAVRAALAADPDLDIVYGAATVFAADERVIRRAVPGEFTVKAFVEHGCHVFSGSTFMRTDLVRAVGGWNGELHYAMDFDLFFRLAERAPRIRRIQETLGGLRWHEASKSGSQTMTFFREAATVRLRHAETAAERRHIYAQMGFRLAAVPLIPIRHSRVFSRLRGVKRFAD